jgi:type II secretory ATPase GspE/PulE/Tfp pilus assembly ATPase PilB-like protein
MNDAIGEKIMERAPVPEIVSAGRASGLRLLREDGWMKVRQGITTVEEVLKCTAV